MKIEKLGLLGFGRFGRMVYEYLSRDRELFVFDPDARKLRDVPGAATFEDTVSLPLVLLCVPISAVKESCVKMAPLLRQGQVVVDTCSVKERPIEWMLAHLPQTVQLLGTHPLFGPDSGREGIAGMKLALCPVRIEADTYECIRSYLEGLQLVLIETTPEEHDRQIARGQAVFHLIARAMKRLAWSGQAISTPGPEGFYRLAQSVQYDTDQLFRDMERENPYAAECRAQFIQGILEIHRDLVAEARGVPPES